MQQILINVNPNSNLSWAWPSSAPACLVIFSMWFRKKIIQIRCTIFNPHISKYSSPICTLQHIDCNTHFATSKHLPACNMTYWPCNVQFATQSLLHIICNNTLFKETKIIVTYTLQYKLYCTHFATDTFQHAHCNMNNVTHFATLFAVTLYNMRFAKRTLLRSIFVIRIYTL